MEGNHMNNTAKVINFVGTKKIICSAQDWRIWWAENRMKKECAERRNRKFTKLESKIVTMLMQDATDKALYADERKVLNA